MKYAEVRKLFEMLYDFDPSSLERFYDKEELLKFKVSYEETLCGLHDLVLFLEA